MKTQFYFGLGPVLLALVLASCSTLPSRTVDRVAVDTATDLSGRWNDTDSQEVSVAMIEDVMRRPWLADFNKENGRKPVLIVGEVRNRSTEHIETLVFTKSLERELINSGKVRFVASKQERDGVRTERLDQQTESAVDTAKRLGQETGADFLLSGVITSIVDAVEGQRAVYYKVNLELIHIETNEKVWIGEKQIKKLISQSRYKL